MGAGKAIVFTAVLFGAVFLFMRSKEEGIEATGDPDVVTGSVGESKTESSVCPGGCMSTGCKKCVKCGSSKCHNPGRNICYNCATQKCGRCPSSNKTTTKSPTFVDQVSNVLTRKSPTMVSNYRKPSSSRPYKLTPNLARPGGNQTVTKAKVTPSQTTRVIKPRNVVGTPQRTMCEALPRSSSWPKYWWYCKHPKKNRGMGWWTGPNFRCKGKLARDQNIHHVCFP